MEEQVSWKGHGFTLAVFAGIVVLCGIFFVLGMTVGRQQGQRAAQAALNSSVAKAAASEARTQSQNDSTELSSYAGVDTKKSATLVSEPELEPAKPERTAPEPEAPPTKTVPPPLPAPKPATKNAPPLAPAAPSTSSAGYLQVDALEKAAAANKEVDDLRKKGFSAIIVEPGGKNKLYRVQVGPFSNAVDRDDALTRLQALGYKPIKK